MSNSDLAPFYSLPNSFINDPTISTGAKAVVSYLQAKPPGWTPRPPDIQNSLGFGDTVWRRVSAELRKLGILIIKRTAAGVVLIFNKLSLFSNKATRVKPTLGNGKSGKATRVKPTLGKINTLKAKNPVAAGVSMALSAVKAIRVKPTDIVTKDIIIKEITNMNIRDTRTDREPPPEKPHMEKQRPADSVVVFDNIRKEAAKAGVELTPEQAEQAGKKYGTSYVLSKIGMLKKKDNISSPIAWLRDALKNDYSQQRKPTMTKTEPMHPTPSCSETDEMIAAMEKKDVLGPKIGDLAHAWGGLSLDEQQNALNAASNVFPQLRYHSVESAKSVVHQGFVLQMIWKANELGVVSA